MRQQRIAKPRRRRTAEAVAEIAAASPVDTSATEDLLERIDFILEAE